MVAEEAGIIAVQTKRGTLDHGRKLEVGALETQNPTGELEGIRKELHAVRKNMESLTLALLGDEKLGITGQLKRIDRLEQKVDLLEQRSEQQQYMVKGAAVLLTLLGIGSVGTFLTQLMQLFGVAPVP